MAWHCDAKIVQITWDVKEVASQPPGSELELKGGGGDRVGDLGMVRWECLLYLRTLDTWANRGYHNHLSTELSALAKHSGGLGGGGGDWHRGKQEATGPCRYPHFLPPLWGNQDTNLWSQLLTWEAKRSTIGEPNLRLTSWKTSTCRVHSVESSSVRLRQSATVIRGHGRCWAVRKVKCITFHWRIIWGSLNSDKENIPPWPVIYATVVEVSMQISTWSRQEMSEMPEERCRQLEVLDSWQCYDSPQQ